MLTKEMHKQLAQETARVKSITFHPSKPVLITALHSGAIRAWDYQYTTCIHDFIDHDSSVRVVKFHPQGDFFISGGDDKIIRVWRYTERRLDKCMKGHNDFIRDLDFHPSKPWIVSASDDQTIKIWNFMTGKVMASASGHSHYVMGAKFFDETQIISVSLDQSIRIWDCKSLCQLASKSVFMPDVVIKQIVDGHERGINSIDYKNYIVTGGDDKEVKVWEYKGDSIWEKDILHYHQGNVTGVLSHGNIILSCGEDGLFCVFDLDTRKSVKMETEGRFWCVAAKDNLVAAGHDSGFMVYRFSNPLMVCISNAYSKVHKKSKENIDMETTANNDGKNSTVFFYVKNNAVYLNDFMTEKLFYKPKNTINALQCIDEFLLIQYKDKFEILKNGSSIVIENGNAVLVGDDDVKVIVNGISPYIRNLNNWSEMRVAIEGTLMHGINGKYFCINEKKVVEYNGTRSRTVTFVYVVKKIICSVSRIAVLGQKNVSILDSNLNVINTYAELVPIVGGFFHDDIFIYSTYKHIKYIFEERGVIRSIDKPLLPFHIIDDLYCIGEDGLESLSIDLIETNFKKSIISNNDEDTVKIIESGNLPGLYPLSYMVGKKRGDLALPYISDEKQRFELCLSNDKLDECLKYCREHKCAVMYRRLADAALSLINENLETKNSAFNAIESDEESSFVSSDNTYCNLLNIAEECFVYLKDWQNLFMFYLCSKQLHKISDLSGKATGDVCASIKVFLGDRAYFENMKVLGGRDDGISICNEGMMSNVGVKGQDMGHKSKSYSSQRFTAASKQNADTCKDGISSGTDAKINVSTVEKKNKLESEMNAFDAMNNWGSVKNSHAKHGTGFARKTKQVNSSGKEQDRYALRGDDFGDKQSDKRVSEDSNDFASKNTDLPVFKKDCQELNEEVFKLSLNNALFDLSQIPTEKIISPYSEALKEAIVLTTGGKFNKAVEIFRGCLYGVAYEITDTKDTNYNSEEIRRKLGVYISGLLSEKARRKTDDPKTNIELAYYFSTLPLEPQHATLAKISAIKVCLKYGNVGTARKIALKLKDDTEKTRKVQERLNAVKGNANVHEIKGDFCFDAMCFKEKSISCRFCFVRSFDTELCQCCLIGRLK